MPVTYLRPGELVEILSYDLFITGIGLSIAASIVRLNSGSSEIELGLYISAGILTVLGLFLWRLSSSIEKRVTSLLDQS